MSHPVYKALIQLITQRMGWNIREPDLNNLYAKINQRMDSLKISTLENYCQLLEDHTKKSEYEWDKLIQLLTVGESYFFRDKGQFQLLKTQLLPDLMQYQQQAQASAYQLKPSLRIWSAGCSTGEEVYSLAILVNELILDWEKWNLTIIGTDVNAIAIEKAKKGAYSSWSFRSGNSHIQQKYFRPVKDAWVVDEKIRSMVSFQTANLVQDEFSSLTSNIRNIDLIVCRNVFIYFDPPIVSQVLKKFYAALRPGGYVMTGHAELHGKNLGLLTTKVFPESVIYTRPENDPNDFRQSSQTSFTWAISPSPPLPPPPPMPIAPAIPSLLKSSLPTPPPVTPQETRPKAVEVSLSQVEIHLQQGEYAIALRLAKQMLQTYPRHDAAHYLSAQAHANLGAYEQAIDACSQALAINAQAVDPYYLLSRIAEERGDIEQAKKWLKKIIYLAPEEITAYLDLASIYAQEGDQNRANTMRVTAVEYLEKLAPQSRVNHQEEVTAGELLVHLKKMLTSSL